MTAEATLTRRDRVRQATIEEMREVARRLLVEQGESAVTLRAVAREMGMTAPALYRYVDSHEDLLVGVAVLCNDEVIIAMEQARDAEPTQDPARRIMAVTRAFRRWALDHGAEFALVFASPAMSQRCADPELEAASNRFGWVFGALFLDLVRTGEAHVWDDADVDPAFASEQSDLLLALRDEISLGARWQFVNYWTRIYGTVSVELFGHLSWALDDSDAVFEHMLRGIATDMGMADRYVRP